MKRDVMSVDDWTLTFQHHLNGVTEVTLTYFGDDCPVSESSKHPSWECSTELVPNDHPCGLPDDVREGLFNKIAEYGQPSDE